MLHLYWAALAVLASLTLVNAVISPFKLDSYALPLYYYPGPSDTSDGSWNASFAGSPWFERTVAQAGLGQGYHYSQYNASKPPPRVEYTFFGTGIEFFGYWGNLGAGFRSPGGRGSTISYIVAGPDAVGSVRANGERTPSSMDQTGFPVSLAKYSNLTEGRYTIRMTVTEGSVSLTHVVTDLAILEDDVAAVKSAADNPVILYPTTRKDGTIIPDPAFGNWTGSWEAQKDGRRVGSRTLNDTVSIDLGKGNYFVELNGTTGYFNGNFRVSLDPLAPNTNGSWEYLGFTFWELANTTLFAKPLDPEVQYTLHLTNLQHPNDTFKYEALAGVWEWLDIGSVSLWKKGFVSIPGRADRSTKSPSSSRPVRAIVGGVIGGIVFLGLLGGSLFWWLKLPQRRILEPHSPIDETFEIDPSPITTPYIDPNASSDQGSSRPAIVMRSSKDMIERIRTNRNMSSSSSGNEKLPHSHRYSSGSNETYITHPMSITSTSASGMVGIPVLTPHRLYDDDQVVQATDAGRPTTVAPRHPVEVPPSYDSAWKDEASSPGGLQPLSESPRTLTPVAEPTVSPIFAPAHGPSQTSTEGAMPVRPPLPVGMAMPFSPPPQEGAILPLSPVTGAPALSDTNRFPVASSITTTHRSSMASGDRTLVASSGRRSLPLTPGKDILLL